jgi:hypothetical protein
MAGVGGMEGIGNDVHHGVMTPQGRLRLEGPCAPIHITAENCGTKVSGLGQKHGEPIDIPVELSERNNWLLYCRVLEKVVPHDLMRLVQRARAQ